MSKRDQKKEEILVAGIEVMKRNGYNGTSVKDIVEAANVPKGSFYNYFASKEAFALEAVEFTANIGREHAEAVLGDQQVAPLARLRMYFEGSIAGACFNEFREGCFLGNMCQEMADTSDGLRAVLNRKLKQLTGIMAQTIREAQEQGAITRPLDPNQTAEFLFNAWEGAIMRAKASKSREPLDAFLNMLTVIL
jgi:TetR/AcrR family transcriptional regulator, transcriptional repressor for nem operon